MKYALIVISLVIAIVQLDFLWKKDEKFTIGNGIVVFLSIVSAIILWRLQIQDDKEKKYSLDYGKLEETGTTAKYPILKIGGANLGLLEWGSDRPLGLFAKDDVTIWLSKSRIS